MKKIKHLSMQYHSKLVTYYLIYYNKGILHQQYYQDL